MILLNPRQLIRPYPDARSREIMQVTVDFFEKKGKRRLKADDRERVWYADFIDFQRDNQIFATLLTPAAYGTACRWDTYRNCEFNEILAFYGLHYWYTWQVSILGLGPIWMSANEALKQRAAALLREGHVFAFGLSERAHGADIYSTEMALTLQPDGTYRANGEKYYIGNGNVAPMVSTFGKMAGTGDYVLFVADYRNRGYELVGNVVNVQSYVADFVLRDYPVTEGEILSRGREAWDTALNTVNVGKYNLGWASIGICTHAFYEALHHAAHRRLYGMAVTDMAHVKRMFVDAYTRLCAMKLFALRASDYQRVASAEDRRYLLYNPVVKMKVTTQGDEVINLLWDVIAAKGFERDMYFEMAARDIRALPKLEGTVHVNIALIVKFMANYFFNPAPYPEVPIVDTPVHDEFLFRQGPASGLGRIRFHDYSPILERSALPNVRVFREQIETFRSMLFQATPAGPQTEDVDFLLALGEIFTLVVYGQLILESAALHGIQDDLVDQVFDVLVRDVSKFALQLYGKPLTTPEQAEFCLRMLRRPSQDAGRYDRVWQEVYGLRDAYEMNP
ncbi:MAG TPA: acyl-CoA dehydrogenase [Anaerolineae bacterium]|nr:acyl-CoA dehydrogenase [Anaerolineae bacterium]